MTSANDKARALLFFGAMTVATSRRVQKEWKKRNQLHNATNHTHGGDTEAINYTQFRPCFVNRLRLPPDLPQTKPIPCSRQQITCFFLTGLPTSLTCLSRSLSLPFSLRPPSLKSNIPYPVRRPICHTDIQFAATYTPPPHVVPLPDHTPARAARPSALHA